MPLEFAHDMPGPVQIDLIAATARAAAALQQARPRGTLTRPDAEKAALRKIECGGSLYRQGDRMDALYEIYVGQFKTIHGDAGGRHQVTGFRLAGELLGRDGRDTGRHALDAVAPQDALVRPMPYGELAASARRRPEFQLELHRAMRRELCRARTVMLLPGTEFAESHVAAFPRDLAGLLQQPAWSPTAMLLRMSRIDIASHLALTVETISRVLTKLQQEGVPGVNNREIHIVDAAALARAAVSTH